MKSFSVTSEFPVYKGPAKRKACFCHGGIILERCLHSTLSVCSLTSVAWLASRISCCNFVLIFYNLITACDILILCRSSCYCGINILRFYHYACAIWFQYKSNAENMPLISCDASCQIPLWIKRVYSWHVKRLVTDIYVLHDDVIKWKHFLLYLLYVRGIHRPSVNSPH